MEYLSRIGRPASCDCDECAKCKRRIYMKNWWQSRTIEQRREAIARRSKDAIARNEAIRFQKHKAKRVALAKSWKEKNPDRQKEHMQQWRLANQEKRKAQSKVSAAIRAARLVRPDACGRCGKSGCHIEGHHEDYSRPLDVVWLCTECHGKTRRKVHAMQ